jgi:phytoene synthase
MRDEYKSVTATGTASSFIPYPSSLAYCRRLTRRANSSFPLAFRVLPPAKRDAMTALYAFFRATDDLADEPGELLAKRAAVRGWRDRLREALAGRYSHRVHAALHHAVEGFGIPPGYLFDVIDGVEADLQPVRFANFAELGPYCYRVASAVGLACLPVWGVRGEPTEPATAAGIAFQLTNILRDVGEDLHRGRVYLPADDIARFGAPPEKWADPAHRDAFRRLMRFQADRARDFYHRAEPLDALLSPDGRAVYGVMSGIYRRLLREVERADFDVLDRRVRVPRPVKVRLLLSAWPRKWGWL